jgi:hypothetical protein
MDGTIKRSGGTPEIGETADERGRSLDCLRTWRLDSAPDSSGTISVEALAPHRRHYLDYEGPVSNDRGRVSRWDKGEYEIQSETASRIEFDLRGAKLDGRAVLSIDEASSSWTFYFARPSSTT